MDLLASTRSQILLQQQASQRRRRRRRRPHPSNAGLRLWHLLEPSLLKLGPPPLAKVVPLMSAAPRRKQLANSSPWLVKLRTTKLALIRSPPRTLRHTRRILTDNFATTLPPASRVLGLGHRNSFPTHPLPII